ncbi:MAG: precorrin-8X methylmutase [Nitrospiraceae bacterium]|nr:precorrin-8X methylmutase [Nitrospiraceae bacterium]
MEIVIIVGHGSPKKDANRMDVVGGLLHGLLHPGCGSRCVRTAYLQFEQPSLPDVLNEAASESPEKIIVHPFFLNSGMHVTKDIPEIISEAAARYPGIKFVYTEPLGISPEIVKVVSERIREAEGIPPEKIEAVSFEKISGELDFSGLPEEVRPVVKRVVHTTADFEFRNSLLFHPDAVRAGIEAVRQGMDIVTDVEMVRAGINRKLLSGFGGEAVCRIGDVEDTDSRTTRAERGLRMALDGNTGIVAIGNAPTALYSCIKAINEGWIDPRLVIGVPVGFVRAAESKALLAAQKFPFITNAGRKGGSTVAAAIVNAIIRMAHEDGNGNKNEK